MIPDPSSLAGLYVRWALCSLVLAGASLDLIICLSVLHCFPANPLIAGLLGLGLGCASQLGALALVSWLEMER